MQEWLRHGHQRFELLSSPTPRNKPRAVRTTTPSPRGKGRGSLSRSPGQYLSKPLSETTLSESPHSHNEHTDDCEQVKTRSKRPALKPLNFQFQDYNDSDINFDHGDIDNDDINPDAKKMKDDSDQDDLMDTSALSDYIYDFDAPPL